MKRIFTLLTFIALATTNVALAAQSGSFTDKFQLGLPRSSQDKVLEFNLGLGATNPKLKWSVTDSALEFSNDGSIFKQFGTGSGGSGGINLLTTNADAEAGTADHTASGGTFVASSSSPLDGAKSFLFTPSAGAQTVTTGQKTITSGLAGASCIGKVLYKTTESTNPYILQVIDGSSNVLSTQTLPTTNGIAQNAYAPFLCPASGTIALQVKAAASTPGANIQWDDEHLGSEIRTANVSQATFYGSVTISGCSANWTYPTTTGAWNAPSAAPTGCTYVTSGSLSAPSTMYPGYRAALPPGEYAVLVNGSYVINGTGSGYLRFANSGNTIVSRELHTFTNPTAGGLSPPFSLSYTMSVSSAQSAADFLIQEQHASSGSLQIYGSGTNQQLTISVYKYPTSTQTAVSADSAAASWSGYITGSSGTTNSASYVDLTSTGASITALSSTNVTCTTSSTSVYGITCAFPRTGTFKISASGTSQSATSGGNDSLRLVDGSGALIDAGKTVTRGSANSDQAFSLGGDYKVAAVGSVTFKIQGGTSGTLLGIVNGAATGSPSSSWSVLQIDGAQPQPVYPGMVASSSAGNLRVEYVRVQPACTVNGACTISSGTPAVSVTRTGTGAYTIGFATGNYSGAAHCSPVQSQSNSFKVYSTGTPTATSFNFGCTDSSNVAQDCEFSALCVGPR
jgi:hypothetical protein